MDGELRRKLVEEYRTLLGTVESADAVYERRFERLNEAHEAQTGVTTSGYQSKAPEWGVFAPVTRRRATTPGSA